MEGKNKISVGLTLLIVGIMLLAMPMPYFGASEAESDSVSGIPMSSTIYVGEYVFDFTQGEPRLDPALMANQPIAGEMGVYIVHCQGPIMQEWVDAIDNLGIEIVDYVHNFAYQVRMTPEQAAMAGKLPFVDWVGDYHPAYKISPELAGNDVTVYMHGKEIDQASIDSIRSLMTVREESHTHSGYTLMGRLAYSAALENIAANIHVQHIAPLYENELMDEAGMQIVGGGLWVDDNDGNHATPYRVHGTFGSKFNQITGLSGTGITVGIADTGLGNGATGNAGHVDFTGRVVGGMTYSGTSWADGHGHGTHCAGLIAANGPAGTGTTYAGFGPYYVGLGLAYNANLYAQKIFSDAGGWFGPTDRGMILVDGYSGGARLHSNSWGANTGGAYDGRDSEYDARSRDADPNTAGNQQMVTIVAAGNAGSGTNTIGSPGNAKNVVTVGGVDNYMPDGRSYGNGDTNTNNPDTIYASSSRGWTDDGRIKPDILAPARNTLSTHSPSAGSNLFGLYSADNRYEWCTGTSQAAPTVAGGATVVYQWYQQKTGTIATPAMVKALLINTAKDVGTPDIPNQNEGWGRMYLPHFADRPSYFYMKQDPGMLTPGAYHEYQVAYIDNTQPFKVTLAWSDVAAAAGANPALRNDLRLQVFAPGGQEYRGNAFVSGWTPANTNPIATFDTNGDGNDNRNNVENVFIPTTGLQTGLYTVRITGFNVVADFAGIGSNNQDYSLVVFNGIDVTSKGTIDIEKDIYPREASVLIEVKDTDLNTNPSTIQTVNVNLKSNAEPTGETVTLTETGADTGIFRGTCIISGTDSAGVLLVNTADTITATYNDANDGTGNPATVTDTAIIEGDPPAAPTGLTVQWYGVSSTTLINEGFDSGVPPTGWSELDPTNDWSLSSTNSAGGIAPEARFTWYNGIDIWRLYSGPIDTTGMASINMEFRQFFDDFGPGVTVKVQTSSDGSTWHDTSWSIVSGGGNVGPNLVTLTLNTVDVGSSTFRIGFTVDGNAYQLDRWDVDSVLLTYTGGGLTDDNKLDWIKSSDDGAGDNDVSHYNIYRSSSSSGPWDATTLIDTVTAGTQTYIDYGRGEFDGVNWWYVVRAVDNAGNIDSNTNAVPEIATTGATATATGPIGGPSNVAAITITYTYTGTPTSVRLFYTTTGGTTWTLAGTDSSVDGSFGWTCPAAGTYGWIAVAVGGSTTETDPSGGATPEAASYIYDNVAPTITATTFADGATGVATAAGNYDATFSESMQAVGTFTTNLPGYSGSWVNPTTYRIAYGALAYSTLYTVTYNTNYLDLAGNALGGDRAKEFTTQAEPAATATATGPTGGPTTVTAITITYAYTGTPTSVNLYYTLDGGVSWTLAGNDGTVDGSYAWTCPGSGTYGWIASAVGGGSTEPSPPPGGTLPESSSYIVDVTPPAAVTGLTVEHYGPSGGTGGNLGLESFGTQTAFSGDATGWTFSTWENTAAGTYSGTQGNPAGSVEISCTPANGAWASGYWMTSFTTGSGAISGANFDWDYIIRQVGNGNDFYLVAFLDTVSGNPTFGTNEIARIRSNTAPYTIPWTSPAQYPVTLINDQTYYLKVAFRGYKPVGAAGANYIANFDNVNVTWTEEGAGGGSPTDHNTLNWTHDGTDVAQYRIYRSDVSTGPWDAAHEIATVPVGTNTYCDLNMGQADAILWWYVVRAEDALGNLETNSNAVQEPSVITPYAISLTSKAANSWVFVSFPSGLTGNIQDILNDATSGDGLTTWSVAKWYDGQTKVWKSYRSGGVQTLATINNQMGVWLYLTANGGDQVLTLSSYVAPSATAVNINLYTGWNLVGYPSMTARTGTVTLPAQADMVAVWQATSPYITDSAPGAVTMSHGNGYWVRVTGDCVWAVQP